MSTTYLQATNSILAETNEVQLTSSNFANAVGIQAFAKDIVNRAYMKVCSYKKEWPFLAAAAGNTNDPFAGNVSVETTAGTRWYLLKTGSSNIASDFGKVDWDSFFLTSFEATGQTAPYEHRNLEVVSYDQWADHLRTRESDDATGDQQYNIPERVIRSTDGRYFGLSPIPDDAYKIYFTAWERPTKLSAHGDALVIPDEYVNVILDYARYLMYMFKELPFQAQESKRDFQNGLREMSYHLIGEDLKDFTDDRTRF